MARFIVLAGPSGAGKSTILNFLVGKISAAYCQKYTTRPSRNTADDERDFIFCTKEKIPTENVVTFESYGHTFAIPINFVDKQLIRGEHVAMVIGHYPTIQALREVYGEQLLCIFVYCQPELLRERIFGDVQMHRISRWTDIEAEIRDIYSQLACVDLVLDNSGEFSSTEYRLCRLLERLL